MINSPSVKNLAIGYLGIGFVVSVIQNIFGELTAFAWTGSVEGNLILLFWWFIVPIFVWPWDLLWAVFHRLF
jgi:hypothetical protein